MPPIFRIERKRSFVFQKIKVPIGYPFMILSIKLADFSISHTKSLWNWGIFINPFSISPISPEKVTVRGSGSVIIRII